MRSFEALEYLVQLNSPSTPNMQSDLHNDLRRSAVPPRLQIITTAHHTNPESLQSPLTPVELRRRSTVAPPSPQKSERVMSAVEEKQVESLATKLPPPPPYPGAKLSFYKRFFCKPRNPDPEKLNDPSNYRFSFLSRGFILASFMLLLLLTVIIAPVVGTWHHRNRTSSGSGDRADGFQLGDGPGSRGGQGGTDTGAAGRGPGPYSNANGTAASGSIGSTRSALGLGPNTTVALGVFSNFADPYILQHEGVWYAYATNNAIGAAYAPKDGAQWRFDLNNVQMAVSTDFYNWNLTAHTSEPLPNVGAWSDNTRRKYNPKLPQAGVWAPMVFQRPSDKKWIMYYSARPGDNVNMHCIGAAVSTGLSPAGPFIPEANAFTCPQSLGGAIDPTPYIETEADGTSTIYIIYKIDGNNRGHGGQCGNTVPPLQKTPIMLQKTKSDGVTPDGDPIELLDRDSADHDGPLVEAPALVKSDKGTYFLFFSSGCTANDNYDVKYATSSSVSGPYVRANKPLLHTRMYNLLSPGSCSLAKGDDGKWRIAFHARVYTIYGGLRSMFTSGVKMNGTEATLFNPDQGNSTITIVDQAKRQVQFAPDAIAVPLKHSQGGHGHGSGGSGGAAPDPVDNNGDGSDDSDGDDDGNDSGDGIDDSGDPVSAIPSAAPTAAPGKGKATTMTTKTRTTLVPRATEGAGVRPGKVHKGRPAGGKGTKGKKGGKGGKGRGKGEDIDGRDS